MIFSAVESFRRAIALKPKSRGLLRHGVSQGKPAMMKRIPSAALFTCIFLNAVFGIPRATALNPSLDITQYSHVAWTFRNGFINGAVYAITQAPDGYFWLGTQSGVVRFDGVRAVPLPLAAGQQLPSSAVGAVLSARDGTLWAGGFGSPTGKLCAIRRGEATCYGDDGRLGILVSSLYEDPNGSLWVGAATGLWQWNPGPPTRRQAIPIVSLHAFTPGEQGASIIVAA